MIQETALEDELSPSCRRALDSLRERRPQAEVVAVEGDWAYVSVGHIDVSGVTQVFEQEETLGIVRIPIDFPCNTAPYGLITVPALKRSNGQAIGKQDRNHQKARAMADLFEEPVGFWSWRWNQVSSDDESDLRKAPDMLRERLQMED